MNGRVVLLVVLVSLVAELNGFGWNPFLSWFGLRSSPRGPPRGLPGPIIPYPIPTCNCSAITCEEPTISGTNCTQLNGTIEFSYCGCCDGCTMTVDDGEYCNMTLGDFPYPRCNTSQDLMCIDGFCRLNNSTA